jgi:DNA-binding MarR family transcriptional regulator
LAEAGEGGRLAENAARALVLQAKLARIDALFQAQQSLGRVLTPLVEQGLVQQATGRADRRQRLLTLTEAGLALERRLFERQRDTVMGAYREAGPQAVDGFRRVMRGLMGPQARAALDRARREGPGRP